MKKDYSEKLYLTRNTNKVSELRKKVSPYNERNDLLQSVAKQRAEAKNSLKTLILS